MAETTAEITYGLLFPCAVPEFEHEDMIHRHFIECMPPVHILGVDL